MSNMNTKKVDHKGKNIVIPYSYLKTKFTFL